MNFKAATTLQLCGVVMDENAGEEDKQQAVQELWNRIGKEENGQEQHG